MGGITGINIQPGSGGYRRTPSDLPWIKARSNGRMVQCIRPEANRLRQSSAFQTSFIPASLTARSVSRYNPTKTYLNIPIRLQPHAAQTFAIQKPSTGAVAAEIRINAKIPLNVWQPVNKTANQPVPAAAKFSQPAPLSDVGSNITKNVTAQNNSTLQSTTARNQTLANEALFKHNSSSENIAAKNTDASSTEKTTSQQENPRGARKTYAEILKNETRAERKERRKQYRKLVRRGVPAKPKENETLDEARERRREYREAVRRTTPSKFSLSSNNRGMTQ